MLVGIPREIYPGENRVAVIPSGIQILTGAGFDVVVQSADLIVAADAEISFQEMPVGENYFLFGDNKLDYPDTLSSCTRSNL